MKPLGGRYKLGMSLTAATLLGVGSTFLGSPANVSAKTTSLSHVAKNVRLNPTGYQRLINYVTDHHDQTDGINESGSVIYVGVVAGSSQNTTDADLDAIIGHNNDPAGKYKLDVVKVGKSYNTLYSTMEHILTVDPRLSTIPYTLQIDVARGKITLDIPLGGRAGTARANSVGAAITSRFGSTVEISREPVPHVVMEMGRPDVRRGRPARVPIPASRTGDTAAPPGFYGSDRIIDTISYQGSCSSAAAVTTAAGSSAVITAGHCVANSKDTFSISNATGIGAPFGHAGENTTANYYDSAVIVDQLYAPLLWNGPSNNDSSIKVGGFLGSVGGSTVCFDGASSFNQCGATVSSKYSDYCGTIYGTGGAPNEAECHLFLAGVNISPGDSGGPVYINSGGKAQMTGVILAGGSGQGVYQGFAYQTAHWSVSLDTD